MVVWRTIRVNTNWKFASDNFNEAYHIPTVHPQFAPMIDDHYSTTVFEMYPTGHNRMIEKLQPSSRYPIKDEVQALGPTSCGNGISIWPPTRAVPESRLAM